jgi:L-lactate dehydrogenase complex protein LldG
MSRDSDGAGGSTEARDRTSHATRDRILARIREANRARESTEHPGDFGSWSAPAVDGSADPEQTERSARPTPREVFVEMFEAASGEVVDVPSLEAAKTWLSGFCTGHDSIAVGLGIPDGLAPPLPRRDAAEASLALSAARGAIAETGSLLLDARDGRRTQLLAPTHVVLLNAGAIHQTARESFLAMADDLPAAMGLHSGPSKSADIGQVMVKGVHGPGRLVALIVRD